MAITHLSLVSIPVKDQNAAIAFYVDKLGFVLRSDNDLQPGMRWVVVAPPDSMTRFVLVTWFPNMQPGGVSGLVLETNDVQADYDTFKANSVEVTPLEEQPWGRFTTFKDLDGNGWVLQQSTAFGLA